MFSEYKIIEIDKSIIYKSFKQDIFIPGSITIDEKAAESNSHLFTFTVIGSVVMKDYIEAGTIVFLFTTAEWLESRASHKATALVALIAFMPTSPNGALGSLDYKKEERHTLAIKSREAPPKFGNPERQKLIDEIHEHMLSKAPHVPQLSPSQASEEPATNSDGEAQANQQVATFCALTKEAT